MSIEVKGRHFPRDIILTSVRWYLCYALSYRDIAEMLLERGFEVCHSTVYRWVQVYGPKMESLIRKQKKKPNGSWRLDETYVKVSGKTAYLYRAVDSDGNTVDFILTRKRDTTAAKRFFRKAIKYNGMPEKVTIDGNKANLKAANQIKDKQSPELVVRTKKYLNNIVEQDHRSIKKLLRAKQNFRSFCSARRTLAGVEGMRMLYKRQFHGDYKNRVEFFQKQILAA